MKHRRAGGGEDAAAIDLTPMLDIVFIMLIFFIVTATFVQEEGIEVTRPDEQESVVNNLAVVAIPIRIDGENRIYFGSGADERVITVGAVRANVQRGLADDPNSPVIIQADERTDSGIAIRVLDQVKAAKPKNVTITAAKRG
ncbi:MAG: biopolymer transporter ExbD [Alphaproteobacteria bacterium]|nr:biopolymer transporter ExbD [Alphaproteobacteria bacterium]